MGEHLLVGALGVDADGVRGVGVAEGSTENSKVCTRLVANLAGRRLDASNGACCPVDVDGGKAID